MASNVSWSLLARILTLAPDIHTSLHSTDVLLGSDMQSLSPCIFPIPVHELPDSALISLPSGRRYIDQCGPSVMSLPTIRARIWPHRAI
jgi:hypothetical protein